MNRKIGIATAILTIAGIIWGACLYIDAHYAKAAEQQIIERRLDYKIENDRLIGMRDRLYQLQGQYPHVKID